MSFCLGMKLNEAVFRGQPEISRSIFENPPDSRIWETVLRCENREGSRASIEALQACKGADP